MAARRKPARKSTPPESRATPRQDKRPQLCKRCAVSARRRSFSGSHQLLVRRFRRERGDDFLETRVAAKRVPLGIETELAVIRPPWKFIGDLQLFQGEILLAGDCVNAGEIGDQLNA